ncbi:MAG: hypothetical protein AABY07_05940 [Nanoarchaeota archaeon]
MNKNNGNNLVENEEDFTSFIKIKKIQRPWSNKEKVKKTKIKRGNKRW